MSSELAGLKMLGVSAHPTPGTNAGSVAIDPERAALLATGLAAQGIASVILATCHRLEVYWWGESRRAAVVRAALRRATSNVDGHQVDEALLESRDGDAALEHLMAVASGLRSLRRGEPEILGQVRAAWRTAQLAGTSCRELDEYLRAAISAARHIRRHLGECADASIGMATMHLIARELSPATGLSSTPSPAPSLLLLGAGAVGESVALAFVEAKRRGMLPADATLTIANRTASRAAQLAGRADAEVVAWEQWSDVIADADIVFASARSATPLITRAHADMTAAQRTTAALWIDLASPPNIAADATHTRLHRRALADLATTGADDHAADFAADALRAELLRFQADRRRRQQAVRPVSVTPIQSVATLEPMPVSLAG